MNFEKKFHDILKGRQWFFYEFNNRLNFKAWRKLVNFEKMLKFHDISKGRHCQQFSLKFRHFSVKKSNFSEWAGISLACFWWWFQYVLQVWWNKVNLKKKMVKFHDISRAGTVRIFLWKKLTSLNRLKFHMHVSDDDSNMFCKFDEIRWILNKCWNFMIFQRPALSAFFYKIS